MSEIKNKILSGLFWKYSEIVCNHGVGFIISVVLARMLTPDDYGVLSLLNIFIAIANTIVVSGFGSALIQKKDADNKDYSTVLYFSIVMSVIAYIILFFAAPSIAKFYHMPSIIAAFRVLASTLIIGAINSVQRAYVQKHMQFKSFFFSTIIGTVTSGITGIYMAYHGFGVWALVAQHLISRITDTVVLCFTVKWKPQWTFSFERLNKLFGFGWKVLCSTCLDTLYRNMYSLIIGKCYSTADLAYYNRGSGWPDSIITNIDGTMNSVLYPAFSKVQDDKKMFKLMMRRSITLSTYLIFPAMMGLAAIAKPLTVVVLTEKWLPSVPFVQFCCFTYALMPIHTANLQAMMGVGRSDLLFRLEIIKKVYGIIILAITLPLGLYAMMIGKCCSGIISTFVNASPNKKLFNYSYFEQIKDITPSVLLSGVMGAAVWSLSLLNINLYLLIAIQVVAGVILYFLLSYLFKIEPFFYLLRNAKSLFNKVIKKQG